MVHKLRELQHERDELRRRLDNTDQALSAAELARNESIATVSELEQQGEFRNHRSFQFTIH